MGRMKENGQDPLEPGAQNIRERKCLSCNCTIVSSSGTRFCNSKCSKDWKNLHDKKYQIKKIKAIKKRRLEIPRETIEYLYYQEKKTQEEMAKILNVSVSTIKDRLKFFRIKKRDKMLEKTKKLISQKNKKWTKEKTLEEFKRLAKELGRTPMALELTEMDQEGLRHAIFRNWGSYSAFLSKGEFDPPGPVHGKSRASNFRLLASKAAIKYYQDGKWSTSEKKFKTILDSFGLVENLDYFHNFKILSPLKGYYELDFYLPHWSLVIECDSFWHNLGESGERDKLRDEWLKLKLNCDTLRFNKFGKKQLKKIAESLEVELKRKGRMSNES